MSQIGQRDLDAYRAARAECYTSPFPSLPLRYLIIMSVSDIFMRMQHTPGLAPYIDLKAVFRFVRLAVALKPAILHHQDPDWSPDDAPDDLPEVIQSYIQLRLHMSASFVTGLWHALRITVWHETDITGETEDLKEFRVHQAWEHSIGMVDHMCGMLCILMLRAAARMLYPPVNTCAACATPTLLRHKDGRRKVTLFTLDHGVCDALSVHLYCYSA